jgi:hypothetical protein
MLNVWSIQQTISLGCLLSSVVLLFWLCVILFVCDTLWPVSCPLYLALMECKKGMWMNECMNVCTVSVAIQRLQPDSSSSWLHIKKNFDNAYSITYLSSIWIRSKESHSNDHGIGTNTIFSHLQYFFNNSLTLFHIHTSYNVYQHLI